MTARAELPAVETSAPLLWKVVDDNDSGMMLSVLHWTDDIGPRRSHVFAELEEGRVNIIHMRGPELHELTMDELYQDFEAYMSRPYMRTQYMDKK